MNNDILIAYGAIILLIIFVAILWGVVFRQKEYIQELKDSIYIDLFMHYEHLRERIVKLENLCEE